MSKIVDDKTLNAIIKETLGLKKEASERMDESYVVSSKSYEQVFGDQDKFQK